MTDGCWVQFWDDDAFQGATLRFDGPKNVNDLDDYIQSDGDKEGDEPDSLKTGSRAWLIVYKDDDYGGKQASFGPNTEVSNLDDYGLGGNISSFKLYDYRPATFTESKVGGPYATEVADTTVNADTVNNLLRTAVSTSLGLIPYIGGTISSLVSGLWPDVNNQDQLWASQQNYINQVVAGAYWQGIYNDLDDRLNSLYQAAKRFADTPESQKDAKVDNFTNLFDTVNNDAAYFVDPIYPESKLGFFLPYATLRLATLRENLQHYEYYHDEPLTEEYRLALTAEITGLITQYQGLLLMARDRVIARRLEMIVVQEDSRDVYVVVDLYSGWRGYPSNRSKADYHLLQTKDWVHNVVALKLDLSSAVSQLWAWFDPAKAMPVTAPEIDYATGPHGEYQGATAFEHRAGGRTLTRLSMWSGSLIDALQVSFDGVAQAKAGGSGGAQQNLDLNGSVVVQAVNGYQTGLVNALTFTTNDGRTMSGGNGGTNPNALFDNPPLPGASATWLTGISGEARSGSTSNDNVKAVTFHWRCRLDI